MRYSSANAFRTALETRLVNSVEKSDQARISRLRKLIVFDRLLSRFAATNDSGWMVKGGVALDLRIGDRARPTQDLDLAINGNSTKIDSAFVGALEARLDDFFGFHVKSVFESTDHRTELTLSFQIRAEVAGRRFEDFALDVGSFPRKSDLLERIESRPLLAYAGIPQTMFPVISIEQHLAEKLHACTQIYSSGRQSTRVKDLVDIVLIARFSSPRADHLKNEIERTYLDRLNHPVPKLFPPAPDDWAAPYRALSTPTGLNVNFKAAQDIAMALFDPVLNGSRSVGSWDAARQCWSDPQSDQMEPLG